MYVTRGMLALLGVVCLAVGVATLYSLDGEKLWLSIVFLVFGCGYFAVALFANDRVARLISMLCP
jgi:4-hydroxybenzoate polyprenyltransferase